MVTLTVKPTNINLTAGGREISFKVYSVLPPIFGINGSITGDFIRWNETIKAWEVKSEPITFNGIVLKPSLTPLSDIEGGLWYKSLEKSVLVCTEAI